MVVCVVVCGSVRKGVVVHDSVCVVVCCRAW